MSGLYARIKSAFFLKAILQFQAIILKVSESCIYNTQSEVSFSKLILQTMIENGVCLIVHPQFSIKWKVFPVHVLFFHTMQVLEERAYKIKLIIFRGEINTPFLLFTEGKKK